MNDAPFHHGPLPDHSDLLVGREPPSDVGWRSELIQVWFNNTDTPWADDGRHLHTGSDEVFVVLEGRLTIEVEGERVEVGPGEFCCFRRGVVHAVVAVETPARTLMIRAPSVDDKHVERD